MSGSPDADCWLVCMPHAGGGASAYAEWRRSAPAWLGVRSVCLPGREQRLREKPIDDIRTLADHLAVAIEAIADRPIVLFGHSFGALLAFEVAHRLRERGAVTPDGLYVSGRCAPHAHQNAVDMSDDGLMEVLARVGGTPERVLGDSDLVRMFLPALRADLSMNTRYVEAARESLDLPIGGVAVNGDPIGCPSHLSGWSRHTTRRFTLRELWGDHFTVLRAPGDCFALIEDDLRAGR